MPRDESIREQALAWAVRAGDPEFAGWEAFVRWLEEDPAHGQAYDEVSAAIADAAELAALAPAPANDDHNVALTPLSHVRRSWLIGSLVASLALLAWLGVWRAGDAHYMLETAPGEVRAIALADGDSVQLSGGTRLELDRKDARFARLKVGQALFTIRHDERRPFRLAVGGDTLVDAGTVFDVRMDQGQMTVAVSEGAVVFNPSVQNVRLAAGQLLTHAAGSRRYTVRAVVPEQVGEWREGRLTFDGAPLAQVAADLSRMTGVHFEAAPGDAASVFSGSVIIDPIRKEPQSLGPLLGVQVRVEGDHWVIGTD